MSGQFATYTPVRNTLKPGRCYWCGQMIEYQKPAVRVAGYCDEADFYTARMHPECFRAERNEYWKDSWVETWPEEGTMVRGTNSCRENTTGPVPPDWRSDPVSKEEAVNPSKFAHAMRFSHPISHD